MDNIIKSTEARALVTSGGKGRGGSQIYPLAALHVSNSKLGPVSFQTISYADRSPPALM